MGMLRDAVLGPEAFDAAFREYIRRWAFKHPTPADFFRTMQNVSGRDLGWFWREWLYSTDVLDLAVRRVAQTPAAGGASRVQVDLVRNTPAVMPVDLRLTLANGQTTDVALPVEIWYGGPEFSYVAELPAQVVGVQLDPSRKLVDVNAANNRWGNPK
jgi:aminopeptidase N